MGSVPSAAPHRRANWAISFEFEQELMLSPTSSPCDCLALCYGQNPRTFFGRGIVIASNGVDNVVKGQSHQSVIGLIPLLIGMWQNGRRIFLLGRWLQPAHVQMYSNILSTPGASVRRLTRPRRHTLS